MNDYDQQAIRKRRSLEGVFFRNRFTAAELNNSEYQLNQIVGTAELVAQEPARQFGSFFPNL